MPTDLVGEGRPKKAAASRWAASRRSIRSRPPTTRPTSHSLDPKRKSGVTRFGSRMIKLVISMTVNTRSANRCAARYHGTARRVDECQRPARGTFVDLVPAEFEQAIAITAFGGLPGGAAGGKTPVFKGS